MALGGWGLSYPGLSPHLRNGLEEQGRNGEHGRGVLPAELGAVALRSGFRVQGSGFRVQGLGVTG